MVTPCGFESHLSHQNSGYPIRGDRNFLCGDGTRKGGTSPRTGAKSVRWTLFSPWESPSKSRCIRYGCRLILNLSENEKVLVRRTFPKSPIRTLAPNISKSHSGFGDIFAYARDGTRKAVKKTCQWHVFRPWENPLRFQTHPVGMRMGSGYV